MKGDGNKVGSESLEALSNLEKLEMLNFPILFITDADLMRGFNYRSEIGLTLYLCKGLKSPREVA